MRVAIRADSSLEIGTGHVTRCLTLAQRLRDRGATVEFVCRDHPGNIMRLIEESGFMTLRLRKPAATAQEADKDDYAHWLGVSQQEDVADTLAVMGRVDRYDWLIVDHYALDSLWERHVREAAERLMVIDDLANRSHTCDLLLDQNFFAHPGDRYEQLAPGNCVRLLGPKYAVLRSEFSQARKESGPRQGTVGKVLVFLGGVDRSGETLKACEAIRRIGREDIQTDVVVGRSNPHSKEIQEWCAQYSGFSYHWQARNIAELMAKADLAIGAAGTATWERCCMGLPTVMTSIAANQVPIAQQVHEIGAGVYLGESELISSDQMASTVQCIIESPRALHRMSETAWELVDGRGTDRVVALMVSKVSSEVIA